MKIKNIVGSVEENHLHSTFYVIISQYYRILRSYSSYFICYQQMIAYKASRHVYSILKVNYVKDLYENLIILSS